MAIEEERLFEEQLDKELSKIAEAILAVAKENLIKNGTWYTGFLAKSGHVDHSKFMEKTIIFSAPYAEDVEFGSDPRYVPPGQLHLWAKRKLGLSDKEAKRAAYFISKKIEREGTDPKPFVRPALREFATKVKVID